MTISENTVSLSNALLDSKSILSRLLAGENIDVQHQNVQTASFDVKNRVLTLPMWENMTNELYDMLVGHEVAHALFTPAGMDPLMEAVNSINARDFNGAKDCLNIVEDARIERLMKDKFPGLVRDFRIGYDQMHATGIFGDLPATTIGMPLADRVNLHFKLETRYPVFFNDEEQDLVNRIALATEWSEVVDLARELYDESMSQQDENEQEEGEGPEAPNGNEGEGPAGQGGTPTDEKSEEGEGEGRGIAGDDGEEEGGEGESSSKSDDEGTESGDGMDDDTDDGESADSEQSDSDTTNPNATEGGQNEPTLARSRTMQGMEQALVDTSTDNDEAQMHVYGQIPARMDIDKVIIPVSEITKELSENLSIDHKIAFKAYGESFIRDQKLLVNVMAKQFDMKKAADVARRVQTAKTGVLDTLKMVNYKFSEDIFKRNTVLPKGKNHGMVIMIDWSGSMDKQMGDTIQQAINLAMFCKRIGIPFQVYGFSTTGWNNRRRSRYSDEAALTGSLTKGSKNIHVDGDSFKLLQLSTSDLSPTEYSQSLMNMVILMDHYHNNAGGRNNKAKVFSGSADWYAIGGKLGLGGTPLDEAIACTATLIMRMRDAGVAHPTAVFLTDGMTGSSPLNYYGHLNGGERGSSWNDITLKIGNKIIEGRDTTEKMFNWLRATTGCRTIGYFLTDDARYGMSGKSDADCVRILEDFEKNKYAHVADTKGYDHYFLFDPRINGRALNAFDKLPDDASAARSKTAFIKQAAAKKAERSMLSTLAGHFAEV